MRLLALRVLTWVVATLSTAPAFGAEEIADLCHSVVLAEAPLKRKLPVGLFNTDRGIG